MYSEEIVSIEYLGMKETYDIEIDSEDHIFWGNGIATSNSHSYAYGTLGYATMYTKHHFPLHFYAAYLAYAKDKQDQQQEIKEIIDDARYNNIEIIPPHISSLEDNPDGNVCIQNKKILFGIIDIKGIGRAQINKLYESVKEREKELGKNIRKWSWNDFLYNVKATSTVVNNLILVGATPGGESRKHKSYEYSIFQKLTGRELEWFEHNYKDYENFGEALYKYSTLERKDGGPSNVKRREFAKDSSESLKNSPFSTKDHPDWIVANERELMGIPISYSSTDGKMIATNMTCGDFIAGKRGKIEILVEINNPRESIVKNGDNAGLPMGFVELKDSTDIISGVMFTDAWKEFKEFVFEGNVVLVSGFRSKKDTNSLVINSIIQV